MGLKNQYAAPCFYCNTEVKAREGTTRKRFGRWETAHNRCIAQHDTRPRATKADFDKLFPFTENYRDRK